MTSEDRSRVLSRWYGRLAVLTAIMLMACGGSGSSSSTQDDGGTSAVAFSVMWDRADGGGTQYQPASVSDCSDVNTVSAAVYNTEGDLLSTGGPWDCTTGSGTLYGVPANQYAIVAVAGHDANGSVLYRGQSTQAIFLAPGSTVDAGLIVAGTFVPVLVGPADGSVLTPAALELQWNAVSSATGYRISLATDMSIFDSTLIQQITVEGGGTTSTRPDVTALAPDTPYYWHVQALDGASNLSVPSSTLQFSLNRPPVAQIQDPADGAVLLYPDLLEVGVTCQGSATDYEDGTNAALAWTLVKLDNPGNVLGSGTGTNPQITITYPGPGPGLYRITLVATDSQGATDTVYHDVTFLYQPNVSITSPKDSATVMLGTTVTFTATVTDQNTGTALTDADLASVSWTSSIDGQIGNQLSFSTAGLSVGVHTITLGVQDTNGLTGSASIQLNVQ